jgi:uncharacterized protein (DUF302 family)
MDRRSTRPAAEPAYAIEQTRLSGRCSVAVGPLRKQGETMYGFTTTLTGVGFDQALEKSVAALKAEGFGILSDIDVQAAMKDKLGVQMPRYRILGACNPPLAHRALQAVPDIGLLLPCNVIVRELKADQVVVGFLDPQIMVDLAGQAEVRVVADAAQQRLRRACASLGGTTTAPT